MLIEESEVSPELSRLYEEICEDTPLKWRERIRREEQRRADAIAEFLWQKAEARRKYEEAMRIEHDAWRLRMRAVADKILRAASQAVSRQPVDESAEEETLP